MKLDTIIKALGTIAILVIPTIGAFFVSVAILGYLCEIKVFSYNYCGEIDGAIHVVFDAATISFLFFCLGFYRVVIKKYKFAVTKK